MTTVKCENGVLLSWDDSIQVGDLITAYHKGYFILTEIVPRHDDPPLFKYKIAYDLKGNKKNGKVENECDASYCRKASEYLASEITKRTQEIEKLRKILDNCPN